MSSTQRRWLLTVAATLVGTGLAMPSAYAFNPQPDPPAKLKNSGNDKAFIWFEQDPGKLGSKSTVSPSSCKVGASCQNQLPQFNAPQLNTMQPKK